MTPKDFDNSVSRIKQLLGSTPGSDEGNEMVGLIADVIAEFVRAQLHSAESLNRLASAMEAQTKMLATVYNLDAEGKPIQPMAPANNG